MPRAKVQPKVNKRVSALKAKPRRGQRLKDERSMVELNQKTDIYDIVRDTAGQTQPGSEKGTEPQKKTDSDDVLKEMEKLAQNSIKQKKSSKKLSPAELASVLSGLDRISVKEDGDRDGDDNDDKNDDQKIEADDSSSAVADIEV